MKRIVFVLGNYHPNISANGVCAEKLMQTLKENGNEVFCVAGIADGAYKNSCIGGIPVYRYKSTYCHRLSLRYAKSHGIIKAVRKVILYFAQKEEYVRMALVFPLVSRSMTHRIYKKIEEIEKEHPIDTVVGIYYPTDTVYAACRFKQKHKDKKFISYFLDPFSDGRKHPLLKNETCVKRAKRKEAEIIECSSAVICQKEHSEYMLENYGEKYGNKLHFLGIPLLTEKDNKAGQYTKPTFVFAGSIYRDIRDPRFILEVFKQLPEFDFHIYTGSDNAWLLSLIGDAENIKVFGKVSHEKIEEILSFATGFVNIGNTLKNSSPSKIIEYMGYLKPIISTVKTEDDSSVRLLEKYPLGITVFENEDPKAAAEKIKKALSNNKNTVSFSELEKTFYKETPGAFCDIAENL